jgi:serine phosphatase RsbU (regulator of sigma subunit)
MTTTNQDLNKMVEDWPQASQYRRSIRWEFSLYVSAIILVMMLATGLVITDQYVGTVTKSVVESLLVQARSYSGPAGKHILANENPDALLLNNVCKNLASDNAEVYWAGIADRRGKYLAHTDIKKVLGGEAAPEITGREHNDLLRDGEVIDIRADTIYTSVPIAENSIELGRLGIASSAGPIARARQRSIVTVAGITLFTLLLGLPLTMIILNRKLRPVRTITDSLRRADLRNLQLTIPVKTRNEFGYLAETIEVMGSRLGAAQQHLLEKDRIERELSIARDIQANILPRSYPKTDEYEFAGMYRSAREIGGDYYDFIEIDDRYLAILVADVSGKSLPGMLVMLLTRDIVRQARQLMLQPEALLSHVNRELRTNLKKGMFVTMFFGVIDAHEGVMKFASAGHNPLIHMDGLGRSLREYKTRGYPLGLMPPGHFDKRIETGEVHLNDGDWLIQYTDGINEAMNNGGREFGMKRFLDTLRSVSHLGPFELIEATLDAHRSFVGEAEQSDDITLLAMRWQRARVGSVPNKSGKVSHAS